MFEQIIATIHLEEGWNIDFQLYPSRSRFRGESDQSDRLARFSLRDISIRLEKFSACPRIIWKGEKPRSRFFGIRLGERRRFAFAFLKKRVAISRRIVEGRRRRRRRREHSNGLKGNNRGRSGKQESRERGGGEERVEPSRRRVTQPHPSKDPWWIDRHTTLC